ncbi:hypothetical protein HDU76_007804 [Blyttiomyces sp. JEL0837]|nr:hypothetical protein HDU76_007804 [Blyttiomyces sp. JEL0837]
MSSLPIIDISAFIQNGDLAAKQQVGEEIDKACREFGFFYLKGHGMSGEQMREMREIAREFFAKPKEEKDKISIKKSDFARGYQNLGENVTKYKKDWHEAIDLYAEVTENHPIHKLSDSKCLKGSNLYPEHPTAFKETTLSYVTKCLEIGKATMSAMALGLKLSETFFDTLNNDSFWVMRIIGYPPLPQNEVKNDEVGMSCGEHTDYGCLTILNQDETTGALQVLTKSGEWINADPVPGAFVINIGDMVNVWTNDIYSSTLHRVIHKKDGYRVSIPFFYEPNFDAVVKPLPGCVQESGGVQKHSEVVYGKHLLSKVTTNFDI